MKTLEIGPGLQGLLSFCGVLRNNNIHYSIHQYSDDALTVFFTLVGKRVEVQFFEDWWNYSFFSGDEDVFDDKESLEKLMFGS